MQPRQGRRGEQHLYADIEGEVYNFNAATPRSAWRTDPGVDEFQDDFCPTSMQPRQGRRGELRRQGQGGDGLRLTSMQPRQGRRGELGGPRRLGAGARDFNAATPRSAWRTAAQRLRAED